MTQQYVAQITKDAPESYSGILAKSFHVTDLTPIPTHVPDGRRQIVYTDDNLYEAVTATYEQYGESAIFTLHPEAPEPEKITWTIPE